MYAQILLDFVIERLCGCNFTIINFAVCVNEKSLKNCFFFQFKVIIIQSSPGKEKMLNTVITSKEFRSKRFLNLKCNLMKSIALVGLTMSI